MTLPVFLQRGSVGLAVALWQHFLVRQQMMPPLSGDDSLGVGKDDDIIGFFEETTEAATRKYQLAKGIDVNGIVGSETYSKALEDDFDGIEVEKAIVLGLNRVERTLLSSFKVVFEGSNKITFDIQGQPRTVKEALAYFRKVDGSEQ
jgi:hypothetical protein